MDCGNGVEIRQSCSLSLPKPRMPLTVGECTATPLGSLTSSLSFPQHNWPHSAPALRATPKRAFAEMLLSLAFHAGATVLRISKSMIFTPSGVGLTTLGSLGASESISPNPMRSLKSEHALPELSFQMLLRPMPGERASASVDAEGEL